MAEAALIAGTVGAAVSAGTALHSANMQKKAAKNAAAAAEKAAAVPVTVSAAAPAVSESQAVVGDRAVQGAARRRYSVQDTVLQTVGGAGRRTLG